MRKLFVVLSLVLFLSAGCAQIHAPEGVEPVKSFVLQRYLGTWYEIARLDHSFERGLSRVTAEYQLQDDGGVKVINRGFNEQSQRWKEAIGRAYFVKANDIGHLKVSFFEPFYGAYVIVELDQDGYQYALVSGPDKSYLWLLARTPTIAPDVKTRLLNRAKQMGFAVDQLIFVAH